MPDRELKPGDRVGRFEILSDGPVAVQGSPGCTSWQCRRRGSRFAADGSVLDFGECVGWHCPRCGEPTSMMGHECAGEGEQS